MKMFKFDKGEAAYKVGVWIHHKLRDRNFTARCFQVAVGLGVGMVMAASEAFADTTSPSSGSGGLAGYVASTWTNFDFSATFTPIAAAVGGAGTLGSGYKLWQGMHDGGQLGDNLKPISALIPSASMLGYASFKTAVSQTGGGS